MATALSKTLGNRRDLLSMRIAIKATELQLVCRFAQSTLVIRRGEQEISRFEEIAELRSSLGSEIAAFEERMTALAQEIARFIAYFRQEGENLPTWIPFNGKRAEKIRAFVEAEAAALEQVISEAQKTWLSVKDRHSEIEGLFLADRSVRIMLELQAGHVHSIKLGKVAEPAAVPLGDPVDPAVCELRAPF